MEEIVTRRNKVVYRDGDQIIKVFNETKPASDIFNEALNLARINEAGIASPQVLYVNQRDNSWVLGTSYIPGVTLAELMEQHPDRLDEYLTMFVDLQISIHQYTAPLLQRQKDKYTRMIRSLTDLLDATTRYELEMRLEGMPNAREVCHGDFNPTNVIVADDGKLYTCDWAHATQGPGAADAAMTYLLFALNDQDVAEKYLDLYCKESDTPKQIVRNWLSIVAASELARHRKSREDFLLHWIDITDYQ